MELGEEELKATLKEFITETDFQEVDFQKFEEIICPIPIKNKQWAGDAILDTLFDTAEVQMKDDGDKKVLKKLKKIVCEGVKFTQDKSYGNIANDPCTLVQDSLFFPSQENVKTLCRHIESAKRNLKICVFTITDANICNSIINRHEEGIKVQVITDEECSQNEGSVIGKLAAKGIDVRTDNSIRNHMHNKFCIIDNSILCTGSFNWTVQAGKRNQENILITDYSFFVHEYLEEFERLWAQFADNIFEFKEFKKRGRKRSRRKKS
ncbi:unnamed protein product [Moneuplotes crassus]|uniref:Mitochondrial cardiolipin hydrolase n=1 Tax=Euplotes crassus TaxID=5936 RepID=A0AAD2D3K0_EUPCR|nr:unnamed protein product [Moneuplotes crassus]